jgi:dipeptidyl aminopeptidase/acylaminoacyl peptidase
MSDTKELLERARARFTPPEGVMESLIRRRTRRGRNRRIAAAVVAIIVALVSFAALIRTFRTVERPAEQPTPAPRPSGIFADVGGWIAYGGNDGIWAVNPTRPGDPEDRIQLSDSPGEPLAWSSDGSKLLIWRTFWPDFSNASLSGREEEQFWTGLFVLNADGTETRVAVGHFIKGSVSHMIGGMTPDGAGGSFSPDGSQVVYEDDTVRPASGGGWHVLASGIYVVQAEGGTPQLLHKSATETVSAPTFSPDGEQIAYFDGYGDMGTSIWVMNADGSDARELVVVKGLWPVGLVWSPDGSRLAFSAGPGRWVWVVGVDGSGLTSVISPGKRPSWSPDGSHIAYRAGGALYVADRDGKHVQALVGGVALHQSVAWNPLPLSAFGDREPRAPAGGATPFVYALVALGVVGVFVLAWRGRRRIAAR